MFQHNPRFHTTNRFFSVRLISTGEEQGRFAEQDDAEDFIDAAMVLNPALKAFDLAIYEATERRVG